MKSSFLSVFAVALALSFFGISNNAHADYEPTATVKLQDPDGVPLPNGLLYIAQDRPTKIYFDASRSSDADGWNDPIHGVSQGGKCEWNGNFANGQSATFDTVVIKNPPTPASCSTTLTITAHSFSANYPSNQALKITDASGKVGYAPAAITIVTNNHPPVAKAWLGLNRDSPKSDITVVRGQAIDLTIYDFDGKGDSSSDPDGWTTSGPGNGGGGIIPRGYCEFNTDFNQGVATFEERVNNPLNYAGCVVTVKNLTFNDLPGTYTYGLMRLVDMTGAVSNIATATITVVDAPLNRSPIALAQVSGDGSAYNSEVWVQKGVPVHLRLSADTSSDPDGWNASGTGVSSGGKCEWNTDLNVGVTTYEKIISKPISASACDIDIGTKTFNDPPGRYVYPVLRITDATLKTSNIASITVVVQGDTSVSSHNPTAVAQFSVNGGAPTPHIYVSRGVPVRIGLDASASSDPDGWSTPVTGVSNGGKCQWNTNLDQSRPTPFEKTIQNPASPSSCNVDLGTLVFNDPPGTYTYSLLRIVDATGNISALALRDSNKLFGLIKAAFAQSGNGSALVTVVDGPNPSPSTSPVISSTPSCNPFGYVSNCPPPTPTVEPTPSDTPSPTPTIMPCVPGELCVASDPTSCDFLDVVCIINKIIQGTPLDGIKDVISNDLTSIIARLFGIDPSRLLAYFGLYAKSITSSLAAFAVLLSLPFLLANILPQLAQWGRFLGSFFTVHKRKDRWGIVVDSDLGKPVVQAVVQVFDAGFNQLKETQVTGADGQFGFLLPSGKYYIVVSEPGFIFPARKKPPVTLREGERIYLGEEFEIKDAEKESIPHIVVPIDREEQAPAAHATLRRYWDQFIEAVDRVGFVFLFIGGAINTYLLLIQSGWLNIAFEILYLLLFCFKLYILLSHQRGVGSVLDRASRKTLDLSIVRLYDAATNRIVQTRVTNKNGRFFILAPRGSYTVSVSKPGYKTLLIDKVQIKGNTSKAISMDFALEAVRPPAV